jgi:hypothetical protein
MQITSSIVYARVNVIPLLSYCYTRVILSIYGVLHICYTLILLLSVSQSPYTRYRTLYTLRLHMAFNTCKQNINMRYA